MLSVSTSSSILLLSLLLSAAPVTVRGAVTSAVPSCVTVSSAAAVAVTVRVSVLVAAGFSCTVTQDIVFVL